MSTGSHEATFYVQVVPEIGGIYSPTVRNLRAARLTTKRPHTPVGGGVTVKLTLRLPDAAFLPLQPEAVIDVSEDMLVGTPLRVQVVAP